MYKVTVKKDGKIIRVRHFSSRTKAEKYEEDNTYRNPIGGMCDFEIEEVKKSREETQC